jgi:hypothetical protein
MRTTKRTLHSTELLHKCQWFARSEGVHMLINTNTIKQRPRLRPRHKLLIESSDMCVALVGRMRMCGWCVGAPRHPALSCHARDSRAARCHAHNSTLHPCTHVLTRPHKLRHANAIGWHLQRAWQSISLLACSSGLRQPQCVPPVRTSPCTLWTSGGTPTFQCIVLMSTGTQSTRGYTAGQCASPTHAQFIRVSFLAEAFEPR